MYFRMIGIASQDIMTQCNAVMKSSRLRRTQLGRYLFMANYICLAILITGVTKMSCFGFLALTIPCLVVL